MARSRSRRGSSGGSSPRQTRATSRKKSAPTAAAEVEVVEEADGLGVESAVAIITAVFLVAGLIFLDMEMGKHFGEGILF